MSIKTSDLRVYGSANMLQDDTSTTVGGAIATTTAVSFIDLDVADTLKCFSSAAGDTATTITITGRLASGSIVSEALTLSGTTGSSASANTYERLLKAVLGGTAATGDVGLERVTTSGNVNAGTCQAGSTTDTIVLAAGASASDNFYNGYVVRTTGGTGPNQIRQVIAYTGATRTATVSRAFGTTPDGTTTYRVSPGYYFQILPTAVTTVRRIFYAADADVVGGASRNFYEKVFLKNDHATLALTASSVTITGISFGCALTVNDSATNGANTRLVAPTSGNLLNGATFISSGVSQNTPNNAVSNQLNAGDAIGVWLQLTLAAGAAAGKSTITAQLAGQST